jgi:hypothetical protein
LERVRRSREFNSVGVPFAGGHGDRSCVICSVSIAP